MSYRNIRDNRPEATLVQVANNQWQLHWSDDHGQKSRSFFGQHAALQWADGKFRKINEPIAAPKEKEKRHEKRQAQQPQ